MRIKPIDQIAKKWQTRASSAGPDYTDGINNPKNDQAQAAIAAEGAYEQGVQDAIGRGAFAKGVEAAGTEKWKRKALTVGAQRYPQGVQAGSGDYAKAFAPYRAALEGLQLPPKGFKGSPANYQRVQAVGTTLRALKTGS
jgi:hypothetical protein